MGGEKLNKKLLLAGIGLIAITLLVPPVMAIGPQKAENNNSSNFIFSDSSTRISTPSGIQNEWIKIDPSHVQMKKAVDFYIGNCYTPSSASEIIYNKWNLLSEDIFNEFLVAVGFDLGQAYYISHVVMAGGVYYKENYVGQ